MHYKFDIESPFCDLTDSLKEIILYGSNQEKIEFFYANSRGMEIKQKHRFEGVIPNMERRYKETESNAVREELTRYLNSQQCPACSGTRLNESARNIFIEETCIPEISAMSVGRACTFFSQLRLSGWRGAVAEKIVKEISERLSFLSDVGLEYLSLNRSAETLSGGEAQRIRLASQIGSGLVGVCLLYTSDAADE